MPTSASRASLEPAGRRIDTPLRAHRTCPAFGPREARRIATGQGTCPAVMQGALQMAAQSIGSRVDAVAELHPDAQQAWPSTSPGARKPASPGDRPGHPASATTTRENTPVDDDALTPEDGVKASPVSQARLEAREEGRRIFDLYKQQQQRKRAQASSTTAVAPLAPPPLRPPPHPKTVVTAAGTHVTAAANGAAEVSAGSSRVSAPSHARPSIDGARAAPLTAAPSRGPRPPLRASPLGAPPARALAHPPPMAPPAGGWGRLMPPAAPVRPPGQGAPEAIAGSFRPAQLPPLPTVTSSGAPRHADPEVPSYREAPIPVAGAGDATDATDDGESVGSEEALEWASVRGGAKGDAAREETTDAGARDAVAAGRVPPCDVDGLLERLRRSLSRDPGLRERQGAGTRPMGSERASSAAPALTRGAAATGGASVATLGVAEGASGATGDGASREELLAELRLAREELEAMRAARAQNGGADDPSGTGVVDGAGSRARGGKRRGRSRTKKPVQGRGEAGQGPRQVVMVLVRSRSASREPPQGPYRLPVAPLPVAPSYAPAASSLAATILAAPFVPGKARDAAASPSRHAAAAGMAARLGLKLSARDFGGGAPAAPEPSTAALSEASSSRTHVHEEKAKGTRPGGNGTRQRRLSHGSGSLGDGHDLGAQW